jgi:dTDP-4-amino-4,6-dideoxygalactose transaminase
LYLKELGGIPGVSFQAESSYVFSNRWLTTMILDKTVFGEGKNEAIRVALEKLNIESRPLWKPLHQQPVFEKCEMYSNGVSDQLFSTGICLPSGSNLSDNILLDVIKALKKELL